MLRRTPFIIFGILIWILPWASLAIDHKNLDEGRPTRLEDPYAIAQGEFAIEAGAGLNVERQSSERGVLPIQLVYGAFLNFQLELGSTFLTNPGAVRDQHKSGDLEISGLYNFNQETTVPALGLKLSLNVPTGVNSKGADFEIKALITKSIDRLSFHLNAAHAILGGTQAPEADQQHRILLGATYPLGAPLHTRTTLVSDLFTEWSPGQDAFDTLGAELGARYQLTQRVVLDAGVGSEFSGPADRSSLTLRAGASWGF